MIFLVPYAYDRMPGGKSREGVPANRLGSKARCDALVEVVRSFASAWPDPVWILVAGYSKDSPKQDTPLVTESISEQMAWYVESLGLRIPSSWPRAWGTYSETREALGLISKNCTIHPLQRPEIYVSTNLGHLPRVWLCCHFLQKEMAATHIRRARFHFVLAKHSFTFKEYFQETLKFFQYLYRFIFKKW